MKIVIVTAFISLAVGIALAGDRDKDARLSASDLDKLQGTWIGSEVGREGQVVLVFSGKLISFQGAFPQEWYKGKGILNENRSPKRADFLIEDCGSPDFIGKLSRGIYKLDEDGILTLAGSMPGVEIRPSVFHPGDGVRVFLLKRKSPPVEDPDFAILEKVSHSRANENPS